jgi:hypothetical protein
MSFDDAAVRTLLDEIVSHAASLGVFDRVASHEPKNAPGSGLSCSVWADAIAPLARASGLASTSGRIAFSVRIYSSMLAEPQDDKDREILTATSALMGAYSGDFTLGGNVRAVDLLGMYGTPLSAKAGYLNQDGKLFRVMEITLPVICNDMWDQVATSFPAGFPATSEYLTELLPSGDTTGATDTANIAALLNSIPAGQSARLGPGVFYVSAATSIPSGKGLAGSGAAGQNYTNGNTESSILRPVAGFAGLAVVLIDGSVSGKNDTSLRNLVVDGSGLGGGSTANGILARGAATNLLWENVTVSKMQAGNIVFASGGGTPNGVFRNVGSWYCQASDGWQVNIQDSTFTGCMGFGAAGNGWTLTSIPNTTFTNCRAEHNALRGFYAPGGTFGGNILLTGCSTDQNNQDGLYLNGLTGIGAVQLTGCSFRRDGNNAGAGSTTYSGIAVAGCTVPVTLGNCAVHAQEGDLSAGIGPHFALSMTGSSFVSVDGGYYAHSESAGAFFNWDGAGALTLGGGILLGVNSGGAYPGTVTAWRGGRYTVVKPSPTSRASNIVPSADPHLTTTLPPNSTFMFEFWLLADGPASAAAELQAGLTVPAGATTPGWSLMGLVPSAAGVSASLIAQAATTTGGTRVVGTAGTGTITSAIMKGIIVTGPSGGTFALNWAQGVSNVTATTLDAGSMMTLQQVS